MYIRFLKMKKKLTKNNILEQYLMTESLTIYEV